jgi:2-oxoisovalerate dehydrogenase E1 component alpha subunit
MARNYKNKLHTPEAHFRPGDEPDFSFLSFPDPDEAPRPEVMVDAHATRDLAEGMVRVLDEEHRARGQWNPELKPTLLRRGLKHMLETRIYDDRMFRMQRQGKLSFYLKSLGEEAVAVGQALALKQGDMLFPTYRQQGLLFVRGRNLVDMMCNCITNSRDNCKGRQLPTMYSWKEGNFFSISGNLATQVPQAVGWAMAAAYKGENDIAAAWIGDGSSAEADFYYALQFAASYRAPCIINLVNNQWAISTPSELAAGGTTYAARAHGFNLPGIRVDGNDLLAVYAVTAWAAQRARQGGGPTLIELYTYRGEGHSSSDDPSGYRAKDEWKAWPLGDPVERLKQHLIAIGEWSEEQHEALVKEIEQTVTEAWKEAQSYGTLEQGPHWPITSMFEEVFKGMPTHLRHQRHRLMEGD